MKIYFATGNSDKFQEAKTVLPELEQVKIDLPEIQELDAKAVIAEKLKEALKHNSAGFIVEDTSLYIDGLNGLPGPLVKWFTKAIGNEGVYKMAEASGDPKAQAKTIIGYATDAGDIHFFEGAIHGTIVFPRGETKFGWDPIFQPDGHERTFAEMTPEEKNEISMRRIAFSKLKDFLEINPR